MQNIGFFMMRLKCILFYMLKIASFFTIFVNGLYSIRFRLELLGANFHKFVALNQNKKFRSFKSKENILKNEDGPDCTVLNTVKFLNFWT